MPESGRFSGESDMENSNSYLMYIVMFLPVVLAFILIMFYRFHEKEPVATHDEEIKSLEEKSEELKKDIQDGREKIDSLKESLHESEPVETHTEEISSIDEKLSECEKNVSEDTAPDRDTAIETPEQAVEYIESFKKSIEPKIPGLMALIFVFVSLPLFGAKSVNPGEYIQVTVPSVVLTVEEVEGIRQSVQGLKSNNKSLASQTYLLKEKISLLESDIEAYRKKVVIQDEDLGTYKKLVDEYESMLVKFTDQVTVLEDALALSKKDTESLKKENRSLRNAGKRKTILGYLMFGLGIWLGSR